MISVGRFRFGLAAVTCEPPPPIFLLVTGGYMPDPTDSPAV